LRAGLDLDDETAIVAFAESALLEYRGGKLHLDGIDVEPLLRGDEVESRVALLSSIIPVRRVVNTHIRRLAKGFDAVVEGRDITTVVFPDADVKFYIDASVQARAERRFDQGTSSLSLDEIRTAIAARDEIDRNKAEGSLKRSPRPSIWIRRT
jgi:cytidylate kinase